MLPEVVTGNFPIVSMAVHVKELWEFLSTTGDDVKHWEGFGTCDAVVDVAFHISSHAFPPTFSSQQVEHSGTSLMISTIMEFM